MLYPHGKGCPFSLVSLTDTVSHLLPKGLKGPFVSCWTDTFHHLQHIYQKRTPPIHQRKDYDPNLYTVEHFSHFEGVTPHPILKRASRAEAWKQSSNFISFSISSKRIKMKAINIKSTRVTANRTPRELKTPSSFKQKRRYWNTSRVDGKSSNNRAGYSFLTNKWNSQQRTDKVLCPNIRIFF